ncbi:nitroreductase family protein [Sarocladium implicatum]|nr:nitroreductase family protein [Sarocladium implicatum]
MKSVNISTDLWLEAASTRRTIHAVKGTSKVSDARVTELAEKVLSFTPSPFNAQFLRKQLVFAEKHKQLWDLIIETAEKAMKPAGEEVWGHFKGFLEMHRGGYGSIMYWQSNSSIAEFQEKRKNTAHVIPQWADHAQGMAQLLMWTALELEGLGASLQHTNSIAGVEDAIKKFCGVPEDYSLVGHLVYGDHPGKHPEKPEKLPLKETLTIL